MSIVSGEIHKKIHHSEMKAVVLAASIVGAVVILWTPYLIGSLLTSTHEKYALLGVKIRAIGSVIGFLNSTLNWIIYGAASDKMRKAVFNLLRCIPPR